MRVKRRDFVHLGHGQPHLGRQRLQVRGTQVAVGILYPVQVLDELISRTRAVAQECRDFTLRGRVELAPLVKGG